MIEAFLKKAPTPELPEKPPLEDPQLPDSYEPNPGNVEPPKPSKNGETAN